MAIPRIDLSTITPEYKILNDPPGMWIGFNADSIDCKTYYPRAGLRGGFDLCVDYDRKTHERLSGYTLEVVKLLARRLAWERYEEAHARATGDTISGRDFLAPESLAALQEK